MTQSLVLTQVARERISVFLNRPPVCGAKFEFERTLLGDYRLCLPLFLLRRDTPVSNIKLNRVNAPRAPATSISYLEIPMSVRRLRSLLRGRRRGG